MNTRIIAISALLTALLIGTVSAVPPAPCGFWGNITIDGSPAPAGTEITAKLNWNERGSIITTSPGVYGESGIYGKCLLVSARENDPLATAPEITFWVDGNMAENTVPFRSNSAMQLDLVFSTEGADDDTTPLAGGNGRFSYDGIETSEEAGGQQVRVSTSGTATVTTGDETITIEEPGDGWERLLIRTDGRPSVGASAVSGAVMDVTAISPEIRAGAESAGIEVSLESFPDGGEISGTLSVKPESDAESAFILTAKNSKKNVKSVKIASVLNVRKTDISNAGDGGIIRSAVIRMATAKSWVDANGGRDSVVILRRADDGSMSVLETRCLGLEGRSYLFEADSPEGLSAFALTGVTTSSGSSSSGGGGGGGGGGSISAPVNQQTQIPDETQTPVPTVTEDESGADISYGGEALPEATTTSVQQESPTRTAPGAEQSEGGGILPLLIPLLVVGVIVAGYLIYRRRK